MDFKRHVQPLAVGIFGLGLVAVAAAIVLSNRGGESPATQPLTPAALSPVSVANGVTTVTIDMPTQSRSGIQTEALANTTHHGEVTLYGSVLDLQPLIDLRSRHDAAQSDAIAARAATGVSRGEWERNRALYEDQGNVSLRAYQIAQANNRADQAKADAAVLILHNIEASAKHQFGSTLAHWAFDPGSTAFNRLLTRQDVLVRVTLPPAPGMKGPPNDIEVQASGRDREPSHLVSPSAQADPGIAGRSFLYRVASELPTGTSIVAYLPTSTQMTSGAFVPSSAVVWYAGQPWAYVQDAPATFARRPLVHAAEAEGGYVVTEGLVPGERVVTSGAGLLLSEEQRPPPGSTGCKDPECD